MCGCRNVSLELILYMVCVVCLETDQGTWRLRYWTDNGQTWSTSAESLGNAWLIVPQRSCALSPEYKELIICAQTYNDCKTKGS